MGPAVSQGATVVPASGADSGRWEWLPEDALVVMRTNGSSEASGGRYPAGFRLLRCAVSGRLCPGARDREVALEAVGASAPAKEESPVSRSIPETWHLAKSVPVSNLLSTGHLKSLTIYFIPLQAPEYGLIRLHLPGRTEGTGLWSHGYGYGMAAAGKICRDHNGEAMGLSKYRNVSSSWGRNGDQLSMAIAHWHLPVGSHRRGAHPALPLVTLLRTLLVLLLSAASSHAELTLSERTDLTNDLRDLSSGWVQSSVDRANQVFFGAEHTESDWAGFFRDYFRANPFTDDLRNYLRYPVFYWGSPNTQVILQRALNTALFEICDASLATNRKDLGTKLLEQRNLRETLFNSLWFFAVLPSIGKLPADLQSANSIRFRDVVQDYPEFFSASYQLNPSKDSFIGFLKAQVQIILAESVPLTPDRKNEVAQALSLSGGKLDIWNETSVLLVDNGGLDNSQLELLRKIFNAVPQGLHNIRSMTVKDKFTGRDYFGTILRKGADGTLNYRVSVSPANDIKFAFDMVNGAVIDLSAKIPSDQWAHIAMTFDGAFARVYVAGKEVASSPAVGRVRTNRSDPLFLCRDTNPQRGEYFKGYMDEVRVYNRALSAQEISEAAIARPVSSTGLVGYYRMEDAATSQLLDSSGQNNHGVIRDGAAIQGRIGNALVCNGISSYVTVNSNQAQALQDAFTLDAWIYHVGESREIFASEPMVNIFGTKIGISQENGFPSDVLPHFSDVFGLVAAHEISHVVDAFSVEGCPRTSSSCTPTPFRARKQSLLEQAGDNDLKYLRSMFGGQFFQNAPQEFFASISNQYFASTRRTLDLAIQRLNTGVAGHVYSEPLNQFLFFADVYSRGTTSVPFYTMDSSGVFTVETAKATRELNGFLDSLELGDRRWTFAIGADGNSSSVVVGPAGVPVLVPQVGKGGIVNAASFGPGVSPGALISIFGANLAAAVESAGAVPLPTELAKATLTINSVSVPLLYVSGSQVNAQLPSTIAPGKAAGSFSLDGVSSAPFSIDVVLAAPGIFQWSGSRAAAQNQDYTLNTEMNPAEAGSVVIVYLTGIGPVDNPVPDGQGALANPLSRAILPAAAMIGGHAATVEFIGLSPGFVGLAQANIRIPAYLDSGNYPVVISVNGMDSNTATISVRRQ